MSQPAPEITQLGAPAISVVIPTRNRAQLVVECLVSLASLDYPREQYEVIVADAASTDDTYARVSALVTQTSWPVIRPLSVSSANANAARNAGIRAARGSLVLLVDDDVIVPPGWLGAMATGAHRWSGAACLGGPVKPLFERPPPRTCPSHELAGTVFDEGPAEKPVLEVWGCNMAIRRDAHREVGVFNEQLRFQQEWEWQQRLLTGGGQIIYLPEAWLWHRRLASEMRLTSTMREFFVRGYTKASFGPQAPSPLVRRRAYEAFVHGLRTGCRRGLSESARDLGLLCGALRARRRAAD